MARNTFQYEMDGQRVHMHLCTAVLDSTNSLHGNPIMVVVMIVVVVVVVVINIYFHTAMRNINKYSTYEHK